MEGFNAVLIEREAEYLPIIEARVAHWRQVARDEAQAALLAAGRPVFVDYTAAWCVTCQVNKRTTLADAEVLADFARRNVALLRADWTRRDPAITQALATLGRNGVPVYVLLAPGQPPVVLTELLSRQEVHAALAQL
jgi:thiol:disulfide interchange protein DsbD